MTQYHSKPVDSAGCVLWSREDDDIWRDLNVRQKALVEESACDAYLKGLQLLDLPDERVPQIHEINAVLQSTTGWRVEPVPALIQFDRFFSLLAEQRFPVATFLRRREDFDYLQEPDFFHEIFGHCAMLTHPEFAAFTAHYGQLGHQATPKQRGYLARLYWFTVEFGLIKQDEQLKVYGGGILSSPKETTYSLHSDVPIRAPFDLLNALRTPYRIDIMQPKYFYIESLNELFELSTRDLIKDADKAIELGLLPKLFESK